MAPTLSKHSYDNNDENVDWTEFAKRIHSFYVNNTSERKRRLSAQEEQLEFNCFDHVRTEYSRKEETTLRRVSAYHFPVTGSIKATDAFARIDYLKEPRTLENQKKARREIENDKRDAMEIIKIFWEKFYVFKAKSLGIMNGPEGKVPCRTLKDIYAAFSNAKDKNDIRVFVELFILSVDKNPNLKKQMAIACLMEMGLALDDSMVQGRGRAISCFEALVSYVNNLIRKNLNDHDEHGFNITLTRQGDNLGTNNKRKKGMFYDWMIVGNGVRTVVFSS
jgi:hypothetical protein